MQQINPTHLREHVALVSQEPVLFDCSIRENIVYGMTEGSFNDDDVYEAAKKANIHKFIIELPQASCLAKEKLQFKWLSDGQPLLL